MVRARRPNPSETGDLFQHPLRTADRLLRLPRRGLNPDTVIKTTRLVLDRIVNPKKASIPTDPGAFREFGLPSRSQSEQPFDQGRVPPTADATTALAFPIRRFLGCRAP